MKRKIGKFGGYFLSTLLTSAASFFSVPLLLRSLGTEQFAQWSLLEPVLLIVSQVVLLGTNYGIVKLISQDKLPPVHVFKKILLACLPISFISSVIVFIGIPFFFPYSFIDSFLFVVLIIVEAIMILLLAAFRAASSVNGYTASSVTKSALYLLLLTLTMSSGILIVDTAVKNVVLRACVAVVAIVAGLGAVSIHRSQDKHGPDSAPCAEEQFYGKAVQYGFPMLVSGLLTMVIDFADRFILKAFFDYSTLTQYVIYIKIAAFLGPLAIVPFGLWWPTVRFRRLEDPDKGREFFRNTAFTTLAAYLMLGGCLWLSSAYILSWFAPKVAFEPNIILILISSVVFMGMGAPMNIGLLNTGKTHYNIYGVLLGAIVHVVCCFALIPSFGIAGAASATALSYFIYTVFLNYLSQRIHPVPFAYFKMSLLLLLSGVLLFYIDRQFTGRNMISSVSKSLAYGISLVLIFMLLQYGSIIKLVRSKC